MQKRKISERRKRSGWAISVRNTKILSLMLNAVLIAWMTSAQINLIKPLWSAREWENILWIHWILISRHMLTIQNRNLKK